MQICANDLFFNVSILDFFFFFKAKQAVCPNHQTRAKGQSLFPAQPLHLCLLAEETQAGQVNQGVGEGHSRRHAGPEAPPYPSSRKIPALALRSNGGPAAAPRGQVALEGRGLHLSSPRAVGVGWGGQPLLPGTS